MPKRVTLTDIAQQTGLSVATVSMVLNDRPGSRISEATASRVRATAAALGYSPDVNARGLRTGRSNAVGFISDEVTVTRFASAMIRGLLDVGGESEYVVMMAECENGSEEMERSAQAMLSRRIDGLLFGQQRARRIGLPTLPVAAPIVVINGTADGCASVLPAEYAAGMEAVEYLIHAGHRHIAMLGRADETLDPAVSVTVGSRMAGINEGMRRAGLHFTQSVDGLSWEPEFGYAAAMQVLEDSTITALLVANDRVAMGAYQAAQVRGLSIPEDLSIMSFDDEQLAGYLRPQVTTMRLPYLEMGRAGMALLVKMLRSDDAARSAGAAEETAAPEQLLIPMPLIERGSVRRLA